MQAGNRNAWLDTLRAIAILSVFLCHVSSSFRQLHPDGNGGWLAVAGIGGHGVDLFFVLSGWLLGCLLLNEKKATSKINIKRFWVRRWLRTLPAYYAILMLTLGQRILQGRGQVEDAFYFIFVQNYAFDSLPFFGISWSLCIEEQFYLLIAPLLLILRRKEWITVALALLILIPMAGRWLVGDSTPWMTHLRIDSCAFGVLLAQVYINYPQLWKWCTFLSPMGILVGLGTLLTLALQRYRGEFGEMPLEGYGLLSGCLVVQAQVSPYWKQRATNGILRYIASRSYSLYLVHIEALAIARRSGDQHFLTYFLISVLISLISAELLYRTVEIPWMTFRDRRNRKSSSLTEHSEESHQELYSPVQQ